MNDELERLAQERYYIEYDRRFNNYTEDEKKQCECGRYIDLDEKLCEVCKNELKMKFSKILHDNFNESDIEILNELYDGEEIA